MLIYFNIYFLLFFKPVILFGGSLINKNNINFNNINLYYPCFYQFRKPLLNEKHFFIINSDLKLFNIYCYKSLILNKCCAYLFCIINQRILKIVSQVSNIV